MTRLSRYVRPDKPSSALIFQSRDLEILKAVYEHRFLRSDHIKPLLFSEVSAKACRVRLRKLWEHRYLERLYMPFILDGVHPPPNKAAQPVYELTARGAERLAEEQEMNISEMTGFSRRDPASLLPLRHNMFVSDFLVSLQIACCTRSDINYQSFQNEVVLRKKAIARIALRKRMNTYLVPDAAVTLGYSDTNMFLTYYLEVVKADPRSGNKTLYHKLKRYTELNRQGFFKDRYNHSIVRAVLIATTSKLRAQSLRKLAEKLPFGQNLFWFGTFQKRDHLKRDVSDFDTESILQPRWQDTAGKYHSLLHPNN